MKAFWLRLSERERKIARACAGCLSVAVIWQAIVLPYQGFLKSLEEKIETRQTRLAQFRRWTRLASRSPGVLENLARAKTTGTGEEEMSHFLKEIERIAARSSIRLLS